MKEIYLLRKEQNATKRKLQRNTYLFEKNYYII